MPRSGRLRDFIKECNESPRAEKLSFIPPFLILLLEIILIAHAILLREPFVIILTSVLLIISIIEILFVSKEIREHYQCENLNRTLTIKLDDFITQKREKNVKKILSNFLELYPEYKNNRNDVYHITCQILQTHKQQELDEEITDKLLKFMDKRKEKNVDDILNDFVQKYPRYRRYSGKIYKKICQIKVDK